MKHFAAAVVAPMFLGVAACSTPVTVKAPVVAPMDFSSQEKIPGRYAVLIQSGGWTYNVKARGVECSLDKHPTDFETAYQQSVRAAFSSSFDYVAFTAETLKPADLRQQDLDAQIFVYEGNISGAFGIDKGFWSVGANANVAMDGTIAVVGPDGVVHQGSAHATGSGSLNAGMMATCGGDVGAAISAAGQAAIKDYVIKAVDAAKVNILQQRLKALEARSPRS